MDLKKDIIFLEDHEQKLYVLGDWIEMLFDETLFISKSKLAALFYV